MTSAYLPFPNNDDAYIPSAFRKSSATSDEEIAVGVDVITGNLIDVSQVPVGSRAVIYLRVSSKGRAADKVISAGQGAFPGRRRPAPGGTF